MQAGPAEVSGRALASVRLAVGVGLVLWGSGLAIAGPAALVLALAGCVLAGPALAALMPRGTFLACPGLAAGAALRGLLAFGFFGCEAIIPPGLTTARGLPPSEVGFALSATALTWSPRPGFRSALMRTTAAPGERAAFSWGWLS